MAKNGNLSKEKRDFLNCLLTGESVALAAKSAGVPERTAYRWLDEKGFSSVYETARKRLLETAWRKLESTALRAVDGLSDVLDYPEKRGANVKRLAALSLLELLLKIRDHVEFEARLTALEAVNHVK